MSKHNKITLHCVFCKNEKEPRAIFFIKTDAETYSYVRFSKDGKVEEREFKGYDVFNSLPYEEGIAFNKVMKIRQSLGRCV